MTTKSLCILLGTFGALITIVILLVFMPSRLRMREVRDTRKDVSARVFPVVNPDENMCVAIEETRKGSRETTIT